MDEQAATYNVLEFHQDRRRRKMNGRGKCYKRDGTKAAYYGRRGDKEEDVDTKRRKDKET